MKLAWILIVVIATRTASADDARTSYVARALDAVRALGTKRTQLEIDLYQACRQAGACSDAIVDARCHHDVACMAAADVILTNLRAANSWVDQNTRAQLVRSSTDYHAALLVELRKHYAALAAELVIEANTAGPPGGAANRSAESIASPALPGGAAPPNRGAESIASPALPGGAAPRNRGAESIDRLCATRDREIHACNPGDVACVPSIPWTRCVAALVWFVGDNP